MDYTNLILQYIHRASNPENSLFSEALHARLKFDAHLLEERNREKGFSNERFWDAAKHHVALTLRDQLAEKLPIGDESAYSDLKWYYGQLHNSLQPAEHDGNLAEGILKVLDIS